MYSKNKGKTFGSENIYYSIFIFTIDCEENSSYVRYMFTCTVEFDVLIKFVEFLF